MVIFGGCTHTGAFSDVWRLRIQADKAKWEELQTAGKHGIIRNKDWQEDGPEDGNAAPLQCWNIRYMLKRLLIVLH